MPRMSIATRSPSGISIFGLEKFDVTVSGVSVAPLPASSFQQILTPEALSFLVELERKFGPERLRLLEARRERQTRLDAGETMDFLKETAQIRAGDWKV